MTQTAGQGKFGSEIDAAAIDEAVGRALDYLRRAQLPHGQFRSYHSFDATMTKDCYDDPTVFVTATILYSLFFAGLDRNDTMVRKGLDWLVLEREQPGVWRYCPLSQTGPSRIPPDTDDTSLIGFVLEMYGVDPCVDRKLLLANRERNGLFNCWLLLRGRRYYNPVWWMRAMRHPLKFLPIAYRSFWRSTECIPNDIGAGMNANVLLYLGEGRETKPVVEYLLEVVNLGREEICDPYYVRPSIIHYLLSRAFFHRGGGLAAAREPVVARVAQGWSEGFDDPLGTAAWISTLCNFGCLHALLPEAVTHLIGTQVCDGSWPRSPIYVAGPRRAIHFGSEELTTALCVEALCRYRQVAPGEKVL